MISGCDWRDKTRGVRLSTGESGAPAAHLTLETPGNELAQASGTR